MSEEMIFNCKNCGASLNTAAAVGGVVECEYCFSLTTVPKQETNPAALSFLRIGEHELDSCNFEEAYKAYEKAAQLDKNEPEAYFGMALATAKVQYLKDLRETEEFPKGRLQPICHDASDKKFSQDKNYKTALELASDKQRKEYTRKAQEIDDIHTQFNEFKKSGLSYDCFLCVKVRDGDRHTEDSHTATKIYRQLADAGYKPFYSEEDIVTGVNYEALILYALHSAKCMLLICSNESYLRTPWVMNEYTRFLNMIRDDEKQTDSLTFVFKGTPVEKLPGRYGKIQGIDFSDGTAIQKIFQFVERFREIDAPEITRKEYGAVSVRKKSIARQGVAKRQLNSIAGGEVSVSDRAKLKIVSDFMTNNKDFDNAVKFCDNVLRENPSNGEAYLLRFLAENKIATESAFPTFSGFVSGYENYEKAIAATADGARKAQIYKLLSDRVRKLKDIRAYSEFIVLPDSSEKEIAELTDIMYAEALNTRSEKIFEEVIKTVTDTDKYVSMNLDFAALFEDEEATPYYKNILSVDEGHKQALYECFIAEHGYGDGVFDYCSKPEHAAEMEERLFSYGYNDYAVNEFLEMCHLEMERGRRVEESMTLFNFVLTMIPKEKNKFFMEELSLYVEALMRNKFVKEAAKYNEMLIANDKLNDDAYFNRVLIKHGFYNPLQLLEVSGRLLDDEDFFSAVNSFAEKHSDKANLYLNINEAVTRLSKDISSPECREFVIKKKFVEKEKLPTCEKELRAMLDNQAKRYLQAALKEYGCTKSADLMDLRKDVTKNENLQKSLVFARAARNTGLAQKLNDILQRQAGQAQENAADYQLAVQAEKNRQLRGKLSLAFTVFALACVVCYLASFFASLCSEPKTLAFFLFGVFGGNWQMHQFFGVFMMLVFIALSALAILFTKKGKNFLSVGCSFIMAFVMTVCVFVGAARTKGVYYGDNFVIKMSLLEDESGYCIVDYAGEDDLALVLPSEYNGKPVTRIGEYAFEDGDLESIEIPRTVTYLEKGALGYLGSVKSIVIPSSVTTMEEEIFSNKDITVYCEAESKPDGWSDKWDCITYNYGPDDYVKVVWGYTA